MPLKHKLLTVASFLCDAFFPCKCLLCGEDLILGSKPFSPLCERCTHALVRIEGKRCRICSMQLISEVKLCTRCREIEFHFVSNYSLFEYSGLIRELIYQYKFMKRKRVSSVFAQLLAEIYHCMYSGMPVIPVPPRPQILNRRGWDHVELLCRLLEKRHGIPILRCLKKTGGKPQKELDLAGRRANISGTIHLKKRGCSARIALLLDDVVTTGATADECSIVLRQAGVEKVYVLSVAMEV